MDVNITNGFPEAAEDGDVLLPEGWTADTDIFDEAFSGGLALTADELSEPCLPESPDVAESPDREDAFTTGQPPETGPETGDGAGSARTTGQEQAPSETLRFSAVVDHEKRDVELDKSELPAVWQKAQVTDRVQNKLKQIGPDYRKARDTAEALGFASIDAMLQSLRGSRSAAPQEQDTGRNGPRSTEEKSFGEQLKELKRINPRLRQVPDEVIAASAAGSMSLAEAYAAYKQRQDSVTALRLENQRLRHNAEAAAIAPVRGVSRGGAVNALPEDDFVRGFEADGW